MRVLFNLNRCEMQVVITTSAVMQVVYALTAMRRDEAFLMTKSDESALRVLLSGAISELQNHWQVESAEDYFSITLSDGDPLEEQFVNYLARRVLHIALPDLYADPLPLTPSQRRIKPYR